MTDAGSRPSVEILIVSYSTQDLLLACLRSIDAHRPPAIELRVAVCDNASTDGSADAVAEQFPAVRLVRNAENVGFGAANNSLAESSSAEHLLLLNSDTLLTEDLVTPLLQALRSDPAIVAVGPRLVWPDGRLQRSSEQFPGLRYEWARELTGTRLAARLTPLLDVRGELDRVRQTARAEDRGPRDTDFLWATCWLLRRRDIVGAPLFDERFTIYDEDLDACRRWRAAGRRIVYVPGVQLVHVGGASSPSQTKQLLMRAGRANYYRHHHGRASAAAYRLTTSAVAWVKSRRHRSAIGAGGGR